MTSRKPALPIDTQQAISLLGEFRKFAFKGNVIDLAVGMIIGAAFTKIIDSLVKSIIMPLIGVLIPGQQGYMGWKLVIDGKDIPYGLFVSEVLNFIIVAAALFLFIVKFMGWVMRNKKNEMPAALTKDQELLTEIRDLLKQP